MNSRGQKFPDTGQTFRLGRGGVCGQELIQLIEHEAGAGGFPCAVPGREPVCDGLVKGAIAAHSRRHEQGNALERAAKGSDRPLKLVDPSFEILRQSNLPLGCCGTAKVEAPAVVSMMRDGGLRPSFAAFAEAP